MNTIGINTIRRRFPFHGTLSSEALNDLVEEVVQDLTTIASELNNHVQPLINSLPGGPRKVAATERTGNINPLVNGLDGSQLYLDMTATDPRDPLLYNREQGRPNTIKEAFQYLLMRIEQLQQLVKSLR